MQEEGALDVERFLETFDEIFSLKGKVIPFFVVLQFKHTAWLHLLVAQNATEERTR